MYQHTMKTFSEQRVHFKNTLILNGIANQGSNRSLSTEDASLQYYGSNSGFHNGIFLLDNVTVALHVMFDDFILQCSG